MKQEPQPFMRGDKKVRMGGPVLRSSIGRPPPQDEFRNC
jgi:hypothetical protein